jgi:signal peptidase II
VVFDDLGYRYRNGEFELFHPGRHEIFARPKFAEGESVPYLTGWMTFRLLTSFNDGALWGVGQGYSWAFAAMSVLATAAILYWLFVRKAAASLWLSVALAFVLGGTLGNLYDRTGLHGYAIPGSGEQIHAVRDFLLFTFGNFSWPVFNFADTYLVTGAIMLVLQSFSAEVPAGETKREPAPVEAPEQIPAP